MTVEQLSLMAAAAPMGSGPERPRCRMCALPAWWQERNQRWSLYCWSTACTNRERLCQHCEAPFTMGVDGAGTKYCSQACRLRPTSRSANCAWCQKFSENAGRTRRVFWPYICEECLDPIKHVVDRLKQHRVSHERARLLLTDPGCEVCGSNVLEKVRTRGREKTIAALVVDHDHGCCPSDAHSCGKCVRGLLCHYCNWAAGHLRDSPDNARALAAYLERSRAAS